MELEAAEVIASAIDGLAWVVFFAAILHALITAGGRK